MKAATVTPGVRRVEHVMGMPVVVDVRDDVADDRVLDELFDWLRFVDSTFSTYRADSDISRLNRGELGLADAQPCVREVLDRCEQLRRETRGYFDVRAVSDHAVDPTGLVKGWSVDRAAGILDRAGLRNYAVNAGGDIVVRGRALSGGSWRVGIQHPTERHAVAAVIEVQDRAVATSGAYARGDHVVDPRTGRAPTGLFSVTVAGPELATADAYATAAFAMDGTCLHWTARLPRGYEAMTITADGAVFSTAGFPAP